MTREETVKQLRGLEDVMLHGERYAEKPYTITKEDRMAVRLAIYDLEEEQRQDTKVGTTARECAVLLGVVAAVAGIIMTALGRTDPGIGLCLVAAIWWLEAIVTRRRNDHGTGM
ncbi:MAG: hypothetical protein LUE89_00080 [Clostridiales bacterium]|nr:hypothetical protein [Clostridiales bacterium]